MRSRAGESSVEWDETKALVLFSGGQDSTVALAWALERFTHVETIGFDYGQRHAIELEARQRVRAGIVRVKDEWRGRLGADHVACLTQLGRASALTSDAPIREAPGALPTTFVPGRNLVFFLYAAIKAYSSGARHLVGGMCETDFSGYPDCRDDALKALEVALNLGMEARFAIETPLMWIDKAATWALAEKLGGRALIDLILEETHTCYLGERGRRQAWGYGCEDCPACRLRARGYETWAGA
jgi:7-cyano-7-deazaguanine synthase